MREELKDFVIDRVLTPTFDFLDRKFDLGNRVDALEEHLEQNGWFGRGVGKSLGLSATFNVIGWGCVVGGAPYVAVPSFALAMAMATGAEMRRATEFMRLEAQEISDYLQNERMKQEILDTVFGRRGYNPSDNPHVVVREFSEGVYAEGQDIFGGDKVIDLSSDDYKIISCEVDSPVSPSYSPR
jgi:hypothetical protein